MTLVSSSSFVASPANVRENLAASSRRCDCKACALHFLMERQVTTSPEADKTTQKK